MKTVFYLIIFLTIQLCSIAQPPVTAEDYLIKSESQKTAGFVTLSVGLASFIPGVILLEQANDEGFPMNLEKGLGGFALTVVGTGCLISSAILFISSERNATKARDLSFHINKPVMINTGLIKKNLPYSLGVSLRLR